MGLVTGDQWWALVLVVCGRETLHDNRLIENIP